MQKNLPAWLPSEEDVALMLQRGFVCMRDSQREFLRMNVGRVGNFLIRTKAIICFYHGRHRIRALNTLTVYIEGEKLTEITSRIRRKSSSSVTEILEWFGKFQGPPTYPPSAWHRQPGDGQSSGTPAQGESPVLAG